MKRITMLLGAGILILCSMFTALVPSVAEGAVPQLINFQGVLKDANGQPVADGSYPVKFEIFNSVGPGGGCLWEENQSVATQGGLFSVVLGSASQGIPDSAFSDSARWLAVTVGNDPEISPRQRLLSVGYSYRVGTVDGATGGVISGDVSIQSNLSVDGALAGKSMLLTQPGPVQTPLSIQGSAGQTANLMEIKDGAGAPLVTVDSGGGVMVGRPNQISSMNYNFQYNGMVIKDGSGTTLGSFDPQGSLFARYGVFAHFVQCAESLKVDGNVTVGGNFRTSGISEVTGNDIIISLGTHHLAPVGIGTAPSAVVPLRVESGGTLHELGHSLGVRHTAPGSTDDFFQAWDNLGNKVASIDASGNMTLDGDMDGLTSTWESGSFIDLNCTGTFNAGGDVSVGGDVGIGTPFANSPLHVGGAIATAVTIVSSPTSSITLGPSHSVILCNSVFEPITVNLPTAAGIAGRVYTIKLIFSNFGTVIIDPFGSETIEGAATYAFSTQYRYVTIVSDGANWWIIANN